MAIANEISLIGNKLTHIPSGRTLDIPVNAMAFVTGNMSVDIQAETMGVTSSMVFTFAKQYVETWVKRRWSACPIVLKKGVDETQCLLVM